MDRILNLTQHITTLEQGKLGVFEPEDKEEVKRLLTFNDLPNKDEIKQRVIGLMDIIFYHKKYYGVTTFMLGRPVYLLNELIREFYEDKYINLVVAFTKRVSEDVHYPDGSVKKISVFKHDGFIKVN